MSSGAGGMAVLGIGVDLVENRRMRQTLERWGERFRGKVFRRAECEYCDRRAAPWRHYAARFAVKEAVAKAFGTGIGAHADWLDIEVLRESGGGAPRVELHGHARRTAEERGVGRVLVSLAHTHEYAVAQVVLLGGEAGGETL